MTTPFLSIRDFRKAFGSVVAVENVSLDIAKGEFVTFLGPSGSGKSTTLYAIAGFEAPTGGDVLLEGRSILNVLPHKRNIGMVFQRYTLFPHLTVAENVAFPLRVRKRPAAEVDKRVKEMLALVRLEGLSNRSPVQLSGGQQQRVALARAMAYDPPVLLMDEPLSALDKKLREEIQVEIRRIHQETGVTILYVTHDQEEALRLSDRIAVFNHGRIEQLGSGEDLYLEPATRFVAGFIGDSNFLPVADVRPSGNEASVTLPDGSRFDGVRLHKEKAAKDEKTVIMIRPQALRLSSDPASGFKATVKDLTFLGDSTSALFTTQWGQEIWMRRPLAELKSLHAGDVVTLTAEGRDSHCFLAAG
jgi:putative spermidine/putrescine transport system ATP-binding protein